MKRLCVFWKLVKAAWEVSERSAEGLCICPDSCGSKEGFNYKTQVQGSTRTGWYAGLCDTCAHNDVCLRQALRRSRGELY